MWTSFLTAEPVGVEREYIVVDVEERARYVEVVDVHNDSYRRIFSFDDFPIWTNPGAFPFGTRVWVDRFNRVQMQEPRNSAQEPKYSAQEPKK